MVGPTLLYYERLAMARLWLSEQSLGYASLLYTTPPYPTLPG